MEQSLLRLIKVLELVRAAKFRKTQLYVLNDRGGRQHPHGAQVLWTLTPVPSLRFCTQNFWKMTARYILVRQEHRATSA